jgi:SAM-dependent methyltransferase
MTSVYDDEHRAAAYAFDRPPVHGRILQAAGLSRRATRALDIGSGAGVSSAALIPFAEQVTGLEPVQTMLAHRATVAPGARFVVGQAEALPFADGSFDLVCAAGSLNYTDVPAALAEVARVLRAEGRFLLYDFSEGRSSPDTEALARWYASFEKRFPPAPGGWRRLVVSELPFAETGLRLLTYLAFDVQLRMTADAYLRYVLSEIPAQAPDSAREWCRNTLTTVFHGGELTVSFPAYLAVSAT